jgi:hypothetical protein
VIEKLMPGVPHRVRSAIAGTAVVGLLTAGLLLRMPLLLVAAVAVLWMWWPFGRQQIAAAVQEGFAKALRSPGAQKAAYVVTGSRRFFDPMPETVPAEVVTRTAKPRRDPFPAADGPDMQDRDATTPGPASVQGEAQMESTSLVEVVPRARTQL